MIYNLFHFNIFTKNVNEKSVHLNIKNYLKCTKNGKKIRGFADFVKMY